MSNILKTASIDITTAFDEKKAAADTKRLQGTVEKSAAELRANRERELDLLLKEQRLSAEQVAKLKTRLDSKNFNDELATEKRLFNIKLKNAQDVARANKNASEKISGAISSVGGAVSSPLGGFSAALSKIPVVGAAAAAALGVLTVGIGALHRSAVKVGAAFEHQVNTFAAVTNASEEERARVEKAAQDIGASTKWSASQALQGMIALGRGGLTPDQAIEVSRSATDLATAQDVSIEAAGSLIVETEHQYGLDTSESERVADVTTAALSGSNQELSDFQEALKYCGVGLHAAGASFEQSASMVMTLADVGVKGSSAGNALKNLTARLNASKDKLSELGIEVADASGNFRALPLILKDLKAYTSGLSETDAAAFYKNTFGAFFANPISALVNNVDKVDANIEKLTAASGATSRAVSVMNQGPLAKIVGIGSKLEALGIMVEKALRPITTFILNGFDDFIAGFMGGIAPYLEQLKTLWARFTAGFGDGGLARLIGQIVGYLTGEISLVISQIFSAVTDVFGGIRSIIDILKWLLHNFASGLEEKAANSERLRAGKEYNTARKDYLEASSKYIEAKNNGAPQEVVSDLAKTLRTAAVRYTKAGDTLAKATTAWKDLVYENSNGVLSNEQQQQVKRADAVADSFAKARGFVDKLINNKGLLADIGGLQANVESEPIEDEEQQATSAEPETDGYTSEQAARYWQAQKNDLKARIEQGLKDGWLDLKTAGGLLVRMKDAAPGDRETVRFIENELGSREALFRSENPAGNTPEDTSKFKDFGINATEAEVAAFAEQLKNATDINDLLAFAKIEQSRGGGTAVSSAFGEVNYDSEYKNKVYTYLEKLTNAARSIEAEVKNAEPQQFNITTL